MKKSAQKARIRTFIIANWKMNPATHVDAKKLATKSKSLGKGLKKTTLVACPPFPFLSDVVAPHTKGYAYGAQDVSLHASGSHTGDVAASQIVSLKASYVIVGHSERRAKGESDVEVATKVRVALSVGLTPIVCVGERERDDEARYLLTLREQIHASLEGVSPRDFGKIIIAYEPVWAIGGDTANTPDDTVETILFIRKTLMELTSEKTALSIPMLYGGSVDDTNAAGFLAKDEINGLLIGRASRDPKKLARIIEASEKRNSQIKKTKIR
ncbi:MAG: triosephosphate isomerase [Parcubacteria group bacterium]|nr:triosephosphate isomerase [Parcubacteria group bacterium]